MRALAHAREARDERHESWALNALCVSLAYGPTPADAAAERCRVLLARAEELGAGALPLFVLAGVEAMRGRLAEAWELYDRGVTRGIGGVRAGVSLYAEPLFEADPARAEEELRLTIRRLDELGIRTGRPAAVVMLAEALLVQGRPEEAAALVSQAEAPADTEDVSTQILRLRVEARVRAAHELALEAVAVARQAESPHLLAGALVVLGELEQGARRHDALAEAVGLQEAKGIVARASLRAALDLRAPTR